MSEIDRALCRKAAAECVEFARVTTDPEVKQTLLTRAQEWLKLAYSEHDTEFERLLTEFNKRQMDFGVEGRPPVRRVPMQQQAQQQQLQKKVADEE